MALTINFIGSAADINHVNLRKQGNEDDRVLAIDIKLVGETQAKVLNELLGVADEDDVTNLFWSSVPGADPESLRMMSLDEIGIDGVWPRRIITLGKNTATGDVKKISFRPRPGHRLDLTVSVSIEAPPKELLDYIVAKIKESVTCRIESQPELDLGKTPKAAP